MKAALLTAINQPLELAELEPCPLSYGQVFVKVRMSGICGAQLQECRGDKGSHFPRLMGHEGCAEVLDIGIGVKTVKVGDEVVMHWRKGDGIESDSPRYILNGEEITGGQVASFCTHAIVSENRLTAVPADIPDEVCALLGCSLSTALGTIESEACVKFGERVLIIGCGGLGLNLIRAAKMAQAGKIVAMDIVREKRAAALQMGATYFIPVREDASGHYDAIIDTSGSTQALCDTIPLLAPSGRYVMVGQPKPGQGFVLENVRHFFEGEGKSIKATQGGKFNPAKDIPRYCQLWRAGLLNTDNIVTHRISLDEINIGLDLVRNGEAGRVMIIP